VQNHVPSKLAFSISLYSQSIQLHFSQFSVLFVLFTILTPDWLLIPLLNLMSVFDRLVLLAYRIQI
jgi:hypothetical protein